MPRPPREPPIKKTVTKTEHDRPVYKLGYDALACIASFLPPTLESSDRYNLAFVCREWTPHVTS